MRNRPGQQHIEYVLYPSYWLVSGLEWHGTNNMAEAAQAIAPAIIPRGHLRTDSQQILKHADRWAGQHAARVVFCADLTRNLTITGTSWAKLGVNWDAALRELKDGPYPSMYLTISERAHALICSPAVELTIVTMASGRAWTGRP